MTEPIHVLFTGRIDTTEIDLAARTVASWAGVESPSEPLDEYWLDLDGMEVYLQDISDAVDRLLLLEGTLPPELDASRVRIEELAAALRRAGLSGSIEFVLINADDQQIGPELTVEI